MPERKKFNPNSLSKKPQKPPNEVELQLLLEKEAEYLENAANGSNDPGEYREYVKRQLELKNLAQSLGGKDSNEA